MGFPSARGIANGVRRAPDAIRSRRSARLKARADDADSPAAAVQLLERAISAHPRRAPIAWLRAAPALHLAAHSEPAVVDHAFERALLRSPHHAPLAKSYAATLRQRDPTTVVSRLIELQERADRPLPAVLVQLLGGRDDQQVRPSVEQWVDRWEQTPSARVITRVWHAWGSFKAPAADDVKALSAMPRVAIRLFFIGRPPQRVALGDAIADASPDSVEALTWIADHVLVADNPPAWPPRAWPSEAARARHEEVRDPRLGFQTRAIRDGQILLRDPGTGATIAPFDSTIVLSRVAYSFGDERLFVLMTGGYGGMAAFIYDAQRHQLIDLGADLPWHMTIERVGTMLANLMHRATVARGDEHSAAIARRHDTSRKNIVMYVNSVENPAHHLSNTFPGIERVVDHGLAEQVDEVLTTGQSEFYGTFVDIFPEFAGTKPLHVEADFDLDPHPYSATHLLVMPGGYFIRRAMIERLVARLTALPAAVDLPGPPQAAPFPVVWLGIRVGSRSWLDQESGLAAVIAAIHARWPEALFVIDGFSRPMGRDLVSDRWREAIDEMHALADRIATAVTPAMVVNRVGDRLRENVLWARAADVYLTPSGSSQHKVGWLNDIPGVIYGAEKIVALPPERRIGSTESEVGLIPVALVGTVASHGTLQSSSDLRTNTENILLDPETVATAVLELIDAVAARGRVDLGTVES